MVYADLQALIDDLAIQLDAPTVLEDHEQRMIVFSVQNDPIDDIRRDSILRRATAPTTREWFRRYGIQQALDPIRIPADPAQGVLGRLCVPVRYRNRLMGYLWLIDDDQRLSESEIAIAVKTGEQAGIMLYEEELTRHFASNVLAHLLSPSSELREASARRAADPILFDSQGPWAVVVLQPLGLADGTPHPDISETLWDVARRSNSANHLHLSYGDHGVLLVRVRTLEDDARAMTIAREARQALLDKLDRHREPCGIRVLAAIGDSQTRLTNAAISYRQAMLAAKVAQAVPSVGDLPRWRDLGVFRTLVQLPLDETAESGLDPRLAELLRSDDEPVVTTLETYLDLACDAKATAEYLHLHRGTLYYRLQKAERMGGIDLRNGNDRLAIHLGFKLARFTGLLQTVLPSSPTGGPAGYRR